MAKKKGGLGSKGVEVLLSSSSANKSDSSEKLSLNIETSAIITSPFQPRTNFDEENLKSLVESIREQGVIQPILVRKSDKNKYEIIAGERRWLAAQSAGLHEVPVVVVEADNKKALEFGIVENVQRNDLNAVEEAEGYKRLIDEFDYDQDQVAKFIGKSRSHITNCLRLLTLSNDILELLKNNEISPGHAKVLVGMENSNLLAKKIVKKKLSVRQAENLVRVYKSSNKLNKNSKDPNIKKLELDLADQIGLKIEIKNKKNNKGSIIFDYRDLDQLNHLIDIVKKHY